MSLSVSWPLTRSDDFEHVYRFLQAVPLLQLISDDLPRVCSRTCFYRNNPSASALSIFPPIRKVICLHLAAALSDLIVPHAPMPHPTVVAFTSFAPLCACMHAFYVSALLLRPFDLSTHELCSDWYCKWERVLTLFCMLAGVVMSISTHKMILYRFSAFVGFPKPFNLSGNRLASAPRELGDPFSLEILW